MDIREVKAIDIHSHFNHGVKHDSVPEGMEEIYNCNLEFLLNEEYHNANIKSGVFSTFASVSSDEDVIAENEYMSDVAKLYDNVYQWVVVDPKQEETFKQADKMLKASKCIGIKIQPLCHKYHISEYADKLFSFANERKTTVLMHPDEISRMPEYVNNYPDMNLIIAHVGGKEFADAVIGAKNGNIYVDTSGMMSSCNNVIEYFVLKAGSEHILFGTDTYSCGFQRGRIEYARIAMEDKLNILCNNAKRLFGI